MRRKLGTVGTDTAVLFIGPAEALLTQAEYQAWAQSHRLPARYGGRVLPVRVGADGEYDVFATWDDLTDVGAIAIEVGAVSAQVAAGKLRGPSRTHG